MTTAKVGGEPEPIEAEFEPLEGAEVRPAARRAKAAP
jgi:hypothetical protein